MQIFYSPSILIMLWLAVTASGLAVVWSTNEARDLTNQLLYLRSHANSMKVEHGQYLLQERSLTSAAGLEVAAVDRLGLRFPKAEDIRVLRP